MNVAAAAAATRFLSVRMMVFFLKHYDGLFFQQEIRKEKEGAVPGGWIKSVLSK